MGLTWIGWRMSRARPSSQVARGICGLSRTGFLCSRIKGSNQLLTSQCLPWATLVHLLPLLTFPSLLLPTGLGVMLEEDEGNGRRGTLPECASGSSHFPREDRHVAALRKQRQASIRDAERGPGGQGLYRLGL